MHEQSVHSRNLLKFVEIYIVNYCIINCFESLLMKLLWEFVIKIWWRICWMNVVNNYLNMLLKTCHLIMMKMWWSSITNSPIVNVCDVEMYHSLLKWMFARSFLKNIRWMFAMNNTSLNLLWRMLWRMLWKSSLKCLLKNVVEVLIKNCIMIY